MMEREPRRDLDLAYEGRVRWRADAIRARAVRAQLDAIERLALEVVSTARAEAIADLARDARAELDKISRG